MKRAIVIGASSGIGRGIAKLLVENNYKVGITGRRDHLLNELKEENPDNFLAKCFDATGIVNIEKNLTELVHDLEGLDLLILSSGTGDINIGLDFEIEKMTIDLNVSGFTYIIDWAFRYFEQQGFGHLVGISSIAGLRGSCNAIAYSASKAYQINYLEGLRKKARKSGKNITVTDVRPGFVNTYMAKSDRLFWMSSVEKASFQIFRGIIKKKEILYVTKKWFLIALILKIVPNFIFYKMK